MGFKEQLSKIKDNWLIIVLFLVVLVVITNGLSGLVGLRSGGMSNSFAGESLVYPSAIQSVSKSFTGSSNNYVADYGASDFAPGVTDRKVVKTTYLTSEVKRNQFSDAETKLKSIVTASGAYMLNEQVSRYGDEKHPYFSGNYQIKVDDSKYEAVISQLKELGTLNSFNQNKEDITGRYTNAQIELTAEKERLARYEAMFKDATLVADKITLSDKIFDQERTVKYLEDSIKNMDQRVDYSTIYLTLNEKRSDYEYVVFVKFSELVNTLVSSLNALFEFVFGIAPWALLIGAVALIVKKLKSRA